MASKLYADNTVRDFTKAVADPEGMPQGISVLAASAAGMTAIALRAALISKKERPEGTKDEQLEECIKVLELARGNMLYLMDDGIRAEQPYKKYAASDLTNTENVEHFQASLRVANTIPTDLMYKMQDLSRYLIYLAEEGSHEALDDTAIALQLCKSVLHGARAVILARAQKMTDDIFAMTIRREAEILFQETLPKIDAALDTVEERLKREDP